MKWCCIYDLAVKPDGSEFIVAAHIYVYLFDGTDGRQLKILDGHKDLVYAVAWSVDGETFASGSADKSVILYNEHHEAQLKFTHNDAIQCLAYCPTQQILLTCAVGDLGLWSTADKNVVKQRVESRCCSCAWTNDGNLFAIGHADGSVTIRRCANVTDEPVVKIDRGNEPIWSLAFSYQRNSKAETGAPGGDHVLLTEVLAITDMNHRLAFYQLNGAKVLEKEINLGFEPYCTQYLNNGQFLLIGGSNKTLTMFTRFGVALGIVAQMDTWIWTVTINPNNNSVIIGCVDGTIACYSLVFTTVHALSDNRYVHRDGMTDVVIRDLSNHTATRIYCHDHVRKVSVYLNKLAVQLSDRLVIYKQVSKDGEKMEYKIDGKIQKSFDCSLLVVTALHIIVCRDEELVCYDHKGLKQREWLLESGVRYMKVIGGPPGRETFVVGSYNGNVHKVFVDNPFAVLLVKLNSAIRCVDVNCDHTLVGVVDENSLCSLFDIKTKECILQEPHCNAICFNSNNPEILCYTTHNSLTVRSLTYAGHSQKMQGFVIGFVGNKVFCLHLYVTHAYDVPFTAQLYQYVNDKHFEAAYRVACLGVVEEDWHFLGMEAIKNGNVDIASKAFSRTKDMRCLQMISDIREMLRNDEPETLIQAYILAYDSKFREAAQVFRENGFENKAMELFTDLRMFDEAQEVMTTSSGETQKMLMRKRAIWAKDSNQPKVAAEMLISSGDLDKATQLIIDNDWMDLAIDISRKIDRGDLETIKKLAGYFVRKHEYGLASKIFGSINDTKSIVEMHVNAGHWQDAFAIADRHPKYVEDVYLPYARHLAERDQFEEAQKAFHKAGKDQEALSVLEQLTTNAVNETRFADAGHYYWQLSQQYLDRSQSHDDESLIPKYQQAAKLADVYYAYDAVFIFCNQPFSYERPENILNMARYLAFQPFIDNVSRVFIYYTIAKIGSEEGAYKSARQALEQLTHLRIPHFFESQIDVMTLNIRAKPFSDTELMQPMCYRCGLNNPFLGGLSCIHCQTPFIISFVTFDVLPLVEFQIDPEISHDEAVELIQSEPPLVDVEFNPIRSQKKGAVILNREALEKLEQGQVVIQNFAPPLAPRYLFNTYPTITISQCTTCCKLFDLDDFEMAILQKGHCPFCRTSQQRNDAMFFDEDDDLDENGTNKIPSFSQFA
ncbi:unnamed protein product [Caenorhabditis angaria]|uniref:Intraflagellar transport protein 122 homolog n=1 Tax=Caenorhabditis angaria TaxID=860376 RepID=A0A9P1IP54_9PELO|nr:unnamed protein product [Caenorhabditis angaria]